MRAVMKMLNTTEYNELSELIADEIISLPVSQKYKKLQREIKSNEAIQYLIQSFEKAKNAYEEVERYGSKHHPDYKKVSQQLIDAKSNLFKEQIIKELKICEKEIQEILNQVAIYLDSAIKVESTKTTSSCGCGSGGCSR